MFNKRLVLVIMGVLTEKAGDITLDYKGANRSLILLAANCGGVLHREQSFAHVIRHAFPYGNPYAHRIASVYKNLATEETRDIPGSVGLRECPLKENPYIACLYSQYKMGSCNSDYFMHGRLTDAKYVEMSAEDSEEHRLRYFEKCLNLICALLNQEEKYACINEVVMPKYIGCASGGGNWIEYKSKIAAFAKELKRANVTLVNYSPVEAVIRRLKNCSTFGVDKIEKNTLSQDPEFWDLCFDSGLKRKTPSDEKEKAIQNSQEKGLWNLCKKRKTPSDEKEKGILLSSSKEEEKRKTCNRRKKAATSSSKLLINL